MAVMDDKTAVQHVEHDVSTRLRLAISLALILIQTSMVNRKRPFQLLTASI